MTLAEQIARIIDPQSWALYDANMRHRGDRPQVTPFVSLAKAEQAIAIVREEAAKVADRHESEWGRIWRNDYNPHTEGMFDAAGDIAEAIRQLGSAS
jgi:hypothetical protein